MSFLAFCLFTMMTRHKLLHQGQSLSHHVFFTVKPHAKINPYFPKLFIVLVMNTLWFHFFRWNSLKHLSQPGLVVTKSLSAACRKRPFLLRYHRTALLGEVFLADIFSSLELYCPFLSIQDFFREVPTVWWDFLVFEPVFHSWCLTGLEDCLEGPWESQI